MIIFAVLNNSYYSFDINLIIAIIVIIIATSFVIINSYRTTIDYEVMTCLKIDCIIMATYINYYYYFIITPTIVVIVIIIIAFHYPASRYLIKNPHLLMLLLIFIILYFFFKLFPFQLMLHLMHQLLLLYLQFLSTFQKKKNLNLLIIYKIITSRYFCKYNFNISI